MPREHRPQRAPPHARILAGLRGTREIRRMLAQLARRALAGGAVVIGVVIVVESLVERLPAPSGE